MAFHCPGSDVQSRGYGCGTVEPPQLTVPAEWSVRGQICCSSTESQPYRSPITYIMSFYIWKSMHCN